MITKKQVLAVLVTSTVEVVVTQTFVVDDGGVDGAV